MALVPTEVTCIETNLPPPFNPGLPGSEDWSAVAAGRNGSFELGNVLACSAGHLLRNISSNPAMGKSQYRGLCRKHTPSLFWITRKAKESKPQKAGDSYTQFALLNPEQPIQMVRKVGPGGNASSGLYLGRRKTEIAG